MDDLPRAEPPRFWIAFGILCAAAALAFVMAVFSSVDAHAQQLLCVPGDALIRQTMEVKKQVPVWEGTIPVEGQQPSASVVLTQSEKGGWTFFLIQNGTACLLFAGTDANPPINQGKGT